MLRGHTTVHDTAGSGTWFPTRELFRKLDCVSPRQAPHLGLLGGSARAKALPEATLLVPQKVVQPHTLWAALGTPGAQAGLLPIPWEKGGCPLFGQPFSRTLPRGQLAKELCHPETFHLPPWIAMAKTM